MANLIGFSNGGRGYGFEIHSDDDFSMTEVEYIFRVAKTELPHGDPLYLTACRVKNGFYFAGSETIYCWDGKRKY